MLKFSEMAKLANTTRRTLIFYDEQGLFKPAKVSDTGYRYYEYQQLYDLTTILGLRHIGLSLEQIKAIRSADNRQAIPQLQAAQAKITSQIEDLQRVQAVIQQRLTRPGKAPAGKLYAPVVATLKPATFWCSRKAVDCTEEEVAQLFSEFYQELDSLALMNTATSGYLTDLPVDNPAGYMDASFRILKETQGKSDETLLPLIKKPAGRYVRVRVANTLDGITRGLNELNQFCQTAGLHPSTQLWQINDHDAVVAQGATPYGWLEYALA